MDLEAELEVAKEENELHEEQELEHEEQISNLEEEVAAKSGEIEELHAAVEKAEKSANKSKSKMKQLQEVVDAGGSGGGEADEPSRMTGRRGSVMDEQPSRRTARRGSVVDSEPFELGDGALPPCNDFVARATKPNRRWRCVSPLLVSAVPCAGIVPRPAESVCTCSHFFSHFTSSSVMISIAALQMHLLSMCECAAAHTTGA